MKRIVDLFFNVLRVCFFNKKRILYAYDDFIAQLEYLRPREKIPTEALT